ncbi:glycosyltransferase family 2 protein [Pseudochrobactrum sp. B5]|uniref:glycosyltransferase family 2 protein n=1 Tax=Pseudochrobactrum sp. B5 TaxID=1289478 RepID=UPI0009524209|nr:glycosyltransferase family 2 protein [Pseudochrobactrum sp. B5]
MPSLPPVPNDSIAAIIVTFNPDLAQLSQLVKNLQSQSVSVVIVDNKSNTDLSDFVKKIDRPVQFAPLDQNYGIAKAHNVGIQIARESEFEYVLLMDQDSIPAGNMVRTLYAEAKKKMQAGIKLACVGPRYEDPRQKNPPPFISIKGIRHVRHTCSRPEDVIEVDYLISSGSLIPLSTLNVVGDMKEELFIDYVDIEWGLRAQRNGFASFGLCGAYMEHDLGDDPIVFFGRKIPIHSPLRHYYHFRNAIWLYKQSEPKANWKVVDATRLVRKFVFYSIFTKNSLQHFKMMTLGIFDGITNRMGPKNL